MPKNAVAEHLSCIKISGIEKNWIRGRGKYQDFPSKIFRPIVPKNFVGEPFMVSLISGIEKFYAYEGYVTTLRRISSSRSAETFRRGTLLCCVSENFW